MESEHRLTLICLASREIENEDPSHDINHAFRVLSNAEHIGKKEGADLDILVPAALFHDIITYPKDYHRSENSAQESAARAREILSGIRTYPLEKIPYVSEAIACCSFKKAIIPRTIEAKILQDADGLEATGAIAIMRTFSSTGQMNRPFYDPNDPFCEMRPPKDLEFAIDLFYTRLMQVAGRMHTKTAREIANRRTQYLRDFLEELRLELRGR